MTRRHIATVVLLILVAPILLHGMFALVPGLGSFVVVSSSMEPALPVGSVTYVVETGSYDRGDVITFRQSGELVTHRIVAVTDDGYRTKGDALERRDGWVVSESEIVGEVVFSVPLYGRLIAMISSPLGYVLLIVIPGVLLLVQQLGILREELGP